MQQQAFIHPCAKGFFIVEFDIEEDQDLIFNSRSMVLGKLRFVHETWTPFNPATDILSSALVWVRLPNLSLALFGFTLS
jgi:hypothetical protein